MHHFFIKTVVEGTLKKITHAYTLIACTSILIYIYILI